LSICSKEHPHSDSAVAKAYGTLFLKERECRSYRRIPISWQQNTLAGSSNAPLAREYFPSWGRRVAVPFLTLLTS